MGVLSGPWGPPRSSGSAVGAVGSGCQGLDRTSSGKTALQLAVGEEHTVGQTRWETRTLSQVRGGVGQGRRCLLPRPGGRSRGEPEAGGQVGAPGPGAHGTGPASGSMARMATVPIWCSGLPRGPRPAFPTGFCPSSQGRCRKAATQASEPGAQWSHRPTPHCLLRDFCCSKAE